MQIPATTFADALLSSDLPDLDPGRREQTVAFVQRRLASLTGPMAYGVALVAALVAVLGRLVGPARTVRWFGDRPLPLLGEYVRLLRSLGFTFVWETWPDTTPSGGAP